MSSRYIPQKDSDMLYGLAAGRCSNCREKLLRKENDSNLKVAVRAHIVGHSTDGPRGDHDYPEDKLDKYDNLILLCPTCHEIIDEQETKYTVELLHKMKENHEFWVEHELDKSMSLISFSELDVAAKAIASGKYTIKGDFEVIQPEAKIQKNKLTERSRSLIFIGISKSKEVRDYLVEQAKVDSHFPERLTLEFQKKYFELRKTLEGDELFIAMFDFAKCGQIEFEHQSASLAILCHLFELCEVFEK